MTNSSTGNFDLRSQEIISKVMACYRMALSRVASNAFDTLAAVGPEFTGELKLESTRWRIDRAGVELTLTIPALVVMFNDEKFKKNRDKKDYYRKGLYIDSDTDPLYGVYGLKPCKAGMILINLRDILRGDKAMRSLKSLGGVFNGLPANTFRHETMHFVQNVFRNYMDDPSFEYIGYMLGELDDTDLSMDDSEPDEAEARIHENILYFLRSPLIRLGDMDSMAVADLFLDQKIIPVNIRKTDAVRKRLAKLFDGFRSAGYFDKKKLNDDLKTRGEDYIFSRISKGM